MHNRATTAQMCIRVDWSRPLQTRQNGDFLMVRHIYNIISAFCNSDILEN